MSDEAADTESPREDTSEGEPGLPEAMVRLLGDYERHLVSERDLAPHTVRAYLGDIAGLLDHCERLGLTDVTDLDLRALRSWLARLQTTGRSRTTIARRATAARVFTAWLHRTGRLLLRGRRRRPMRALGRRAGLLLRRLPVRTRRHHRRRPNRKRKHHQH